MPNPQYQPPRRPPLRVLVATILTLLTLLIGGSIYDGNPFESKVAAQAVSPILGISGTHFTVTTGGVTTAKFLVFISYFGALIPNNGEENYYNTIQTYFQFAKDKGFDGVRIFPNWSSSNFCGGAYPVMTATGINLAQGQRLVNVLDIARQIGLLVDLSWHMESVPGLSKTTYKNNLQWIAGQLTGPAYRHVYFDLENEHNHYAVDPGNGCGKPGWIVDPNPIYGPSMQDLVNAVYAGDPNRIVTGSFTPGRTLDPSLPPPPCEQNPPNDPPDRYVEALCDAYHYPAATPRYHFLAYHNLREYDGSNHTLQPTRTATQVTALKNYITTYVLPQYRTPIHFQEPDKWKATGPQSNTTGPDFVEMARGAKSAGAAAWTFHTEAFYYGVSGLPSPVEFYFIDHLIPDVVNYGTWLQW